MNLYLEESSKIKTDDAMAFITDDDLHILEFSENVLKFLEINMDQWKHLEEVSGKPLQIQNIIVSLDEIMQNEFGMSILPQNEESSIASKLVNDLK